MAGELAAERTTLVSKLGTVRWVSLILGSCNVGLIVIGGFLMVSILPGCTGGDQVPFVLVSLVAIVRLMYMVGAGRAQQATAVTIISHVQDSSVDVDAVIRHERRRRYKRWLWWTRFGMVVTALQFLVALYLICIMAKDFSSDRNSGKCLGKDSDGRSWKHTLLICFLVLVWLVIIIQCSMGSDVLRWRSFYSTHDTAWKAHYREVFDHGIREVLCCLGRVKYLSVLEDDEVYSVARLLGDLVAYRASGTGHLELLAGLALLQKHKQSPILYNEFMEAPETRIQEAAALHQFAEAAYTGPLLDFGRNPVLFPCAWLYRQGVLTPWTRYRQPVLEGDNWWRGHAAAFLKYVNLSPETLRKGRVSQTKREAAYFIVVLHELRSIVISVRGTETPEDLLTDGLCKECILSEDDLDGLLKNNDHLPSNVRESVLSTFPHYGHSGIVESTRELFMQIDGQLGDKDDSNSGKSGFLSTLLGMGCGCHGYKLRIVGHSLGGAVATLLGLRLYGRYPNLHVYAYGPLPCVDSVISEACSDFVTSIVYNDEFSARLSVNSILRLRAAAISALSNDAAANTAIISKLVQRILHVRKSNENENHRSSAPSLQSGTTIVEDCNLIHKGKHLKYTIKGGSFLCGHAISCLMNPPNCTKSSCVMGDCEISPGITSKARGKSDEEAYTFAMGSVQPDQELDRCEVSCFDNSGNDIMEGIDVHRNSEFLKDGPYGHSSSYKKTFFEGLDDFLSFGDQASPSVNEPFSPIDMPIGESPEMSLPGLIIHIVREQKSTAPVWKSWIVNDTERDYKAFMANRESFKDIIVSPSMFLDHLPWRCHHAIQRVLEARKRQGQLNDDLFDGEDKV